MRIAGRKADEKQRGRRNKCLLNKPTNPENNMQHLRLERRASSITFTNRNRVKKYCGQNMCHNYWTVKAKEEN